MQPKASDRKCHRCGRRVPAYYLPVAGFRNGYRVTRYRWHLRPGGLAVCAGSDAVTTNAYARA